MNAIVSITRDWGIGREGSLIVPNRADMRRFVELTTGGTVIMGRKTFESLPHGALKNRRNIVLTRSAAFEAEGAEVAHGRDECLRMVSADDADRVWVIGGAEVYRLLIGQCQRSFVTVNDTIEPADAFFPNLDEDENWCLERCEGRGTTEAGIAYEFLVYANCTVSRPWDCGRQ